MIKIFFSYSHRDETYRDELEVHLSMLKHQGIVETWHDRRIGAGEAIDSEISSHLETADVILLLVSPYFIASEYCYDIEMRRSLERHEKKQARVIPVIVHPCDWHHAPFGKLRATPADGKPISKHPNIHEAFLTVAKDVRQAAEAMLKVTGENRRAARRQKSTASPSESVDLRSSNLRVKKHFSDHDRDEFLERAFTYLANFFENSLKELEARHEEIRTRFKRVDLNRFSAAIYVRDEKATSCRIFTGGELAGDITYAAGGVGPSNTYNEALTVVDDGYTLLLRPMIGLQILTHPLEEALTEHGAAEHLWSILVEPLQS